MRVDLTRVRDALLRHGYKVIDAEVLLIAAREEEVTIYPSGKLLIKTSKKDIAMRVADEVYTILENEGII
jgi:hypothetical protein